MTQPNSSKVRIDNVEIRFSGRAPHEDVEAVQRVSVDIREGEFVCIVGPSGCGKTTLLRAIAGLQPVSSGNIDVTLTDPKRPATAMVFQGAAVFPWMTVLENVAYGLRMRGVPYGEQVKTAREWVKRVKLERFAEAYPHQLSGGMQQRVGLARAFAFNPEVLLMDEPFGALDAQTRLVLQDTLLELWQASRSTVVFVTHSIDEALTLADRVLIMSARPGKIIGEEHVSLARPRDAVTLRSDPAFGAMFGRIWTLLRDQAA